MIAFVLLAQDQDRLGTIPDWIAALGTVAAFGVALRLLAKELAARREVEDDRRRAQARLVVSWTGTRIEPSEHGSGDKETVLYVLTKNSSEEPVYNVVAKLTIRGEQRLDATVTLPILPPGETDRKKAPVSGEPGPITLSFTDTAGRRWTRYPDGRLVGPPWRRRSRKDSMDAWIAGELDRLDY